MFLSPGLVNLALSLKQFCLHSLLAGGGLIVNSNSKRKTHSVLLPWASPQSNLLHLSTHGLWILGPFQLCLNFINKKEIIIWLSQFYFGVMDNLMKKLKYLFLLILVWPWIKSTSETEFYSDTIGINCGYLWLQFFSSPTNFSSLSN